MKAFLLACIFLCSTPAVSSSYVDKSFTKAAQEVGVPEQLLRAICFAESNHRQGAFNPGDGGSKNHAIGLCQLLISTAKTYVKQDPKCNRDFKKNKRLPRTYRECNLFGPYTNILAAAKYLKYNLDRYNGNWRNAIASYNSGSPKPCPKSGRVKTANGYVIKCTPGELMNQYYVDRVFTALHRGR